MSVVILKLLYSLRGRVRGASEFPILSEIPIEYVMLLIHFLCWNHQPLFLPFAAMHFAAAAALLAGSILATAYGDPIEARAGCLHDDLLGYLLGAEYTSQSL